MARETFNLTNDTQINIYDTGDKDMFCTGLFMGSSCIKQGVRGLVSYESIPWDRTVELAEWILRQNQWITEAKDMYIWCKKNGKGHIPFTIHAGADTVTFEIRGYDDEGHMSASAHQILDRESVKRIRDKLSLWLEEGD